MRNLMRRLRPSWAYASVRNALVALGNGHSPRRIVWELRCTCDFEPDGYAFCPYVRKEARLAQRHDSVGTEPDSDEYDVYSTMGPYS